MTKEVWFLAFWHLLSETSESHTNLMCMPLMWLGASLCVLVSFCPSVFLFEMATTSTRYPLCNSLAHLPPGERSVCYYVTVKEGTEVQLVVLICSWALFYFKTQNMRVVALINVWMLCWLKRVAWQYENPFFLCWQIPRCSMFFITLECTVRSEELFVLSFKAEFPSRVLYIISLS